MFQNNLSSVLPAGLVLARPLSSAEELYDLVKDPNEWTNLAGDPAYAGIISRFRTAVPKNQAPLSNVSYYSINDYWKAKAQPERKTN